MKGNTPFLVLKQKRDGSRNGIRIRQLKQKMGTHAVASGEVEFIDAEAFMLSGAASGDGSPSDGRGMARLMAMTNGARLGVAMMGLGCARRALTEALCYASARSSWRTPLIEHPLMRRKLAEMIVDVEAVQAMLFEGYGYPNHQRPEMAHERARIVPPLAKLKAARLGIATASDAIEIHGGNDTSKRGRWRASFATRRSTRCGGPDNLCLDAVGGSSEAADVPFLARINEALDNAGEAIPVAASSASARRTCAVPSMPGSSSRRRRPKLGSFHSRSSWPRYTPPPSSASEPSGNCARSTTTANRSLRRCTRRGT